MVDRPILDPGNVISAAMNQEFLLKVQKGIIPGHSIFSKFAENPSIQIANPADIWDFPSVDSYTFSTTAAIDSISSDNAGDSILIVVIGLDADFKRVNQTATLTGQTRVALGTPLIRVFRMFNGNGTDLLGNVYLYENTAISGGVPTDSTKVRCFIAIGEGQSLLGVLTIPAKTTGYFLGLTSSISRQPAAANAIFTGKIRGDGGVFRTAIRYNMGTTGSSYVTIFPTANSRFPAKTDFVASSSVSGNGTGVSITFDILFVEDGF